MQKLSHDHHRGLVLARRVKESLSKPETSVAAVRSQILAQFEAVLIKHSDLEERFLAPPLRSAGRSVLADRLRRDHDALGTLVTLGVAMTVDDAQTFADILEGHIRFEERQLFEEVQPVLNDNERRALGDAVAQS